MAEVRTEDAAGRQAADRVTGGAMLHESLLSSGGGIVVGRLKLMVPPCLEIGGRQCDHEERHLGVLHAAEFRALSAIDAGPIGFDAKSVRLARYHVHLACELWHPEGMHDIARPEVQLNRYACGNHQ